MSKAVHRSLDLFRNNLNKKSNEELLDVALWRGWSSETQLSPLGQAPPAPLALGRTSGHGERPGFWKRATEWLKHETHEEQV